MYNTCGWIKAACDHVCIHVGCTHKIIIILLYASEPTERQTAFILNLISFFLPISRWQIIYSRLCTRNGDQGWGDAFVIRPASLRFARRGLIAVITYDAVRRRLQHTDFAAPRDLSHESCQTILLRARACTRGRRVTFRHISARSVWNF